MIIDWSEINVREATIRYRKHSEAKDPEDRLPLEWFLKELENGGIRLSYYGKEGCRPKQLRKRLLDILGA